MRISLIGPGDIEYHYLTTLNFSKKEFEKELNEIAKVLKKHEICILPDRGVCFEIAKKYKELKGKKVIGTIPLSDKDFGIKHLEPYRPICDKEIDIGNWYKQHLVQILIGDVVLMLGNSLGTMGELTEGFYLYKLFNGKKVQITKNKIHKDIKAGTKFPFTLIVYKPFFKEDINYEITRYIEKVGGRIYYVENAQKLKEKLLKL